MNMKWKPEVERLFGKLYLVYEKLEMVEESLKDNECSELQKKRDALIIMRDRITDKLKEIK